MGADRPAAGDAPARRLRGRLVAPLFWATFGATLVRYEIAGRWALRGGLRDFEWSMARLQRSLGRCFTAFGLDIDVQRDPAVREHTPYLVISNHQSLLDIPLIGGALFTNLPKYVAKKELSSGIPAISLNLREGEHAVIDRSDPRQAVAEIVALGERSAARGTSAVIFPEGTRARDGRLGRFRRAGSQTLLDAAPELQVVPIALSGSWRLNALSPFPVGETVRLRIGAPIARDRPSGEVFREAVAWIRANVDDPQDVSA
ncbi:lysophospholipid acyltransferase family protein [Salsipaludibacter albus]|uniref:lysophospholipid acyltransferase family protein n=1 Tax=Salsipaludibacter albus TaxID=2849650 RepID=UPI001EE3E00E|nr:lysophospholipid acyltransferase family protein [Salsipaludibacter albus]MBY5163246.1 1-acyl-sn-glycerol-3-phosphate acyltransferase [Salsipaludibacter albus]